MFNKKKFASKRLSDRQPFVNILIHKLENVGLGFRPLTKRLIIDNGDTVLVSTENRRIIKKRKFSFGPEYNLTLKD